MIGMKRIEFESYLAPNGTLFVCDNRSAGFEIRRVFFVSAESGSIRGQHAHRHQTQLLACVSGSVLVEAVLPDGTEESVLLEQGFAVVVNPMIWTTQLFRTPNSVLLVLCDDYFDESDYVRTFAEFLDVGCK